MSHHKETPAAGTARALEIVALQADTFQIAPRPLVINRLARRFGISAEVAALLVELSGLGPREARR